MVCLANSFVPELWHRLDDKCRLNSLKHFVNVNVIFDPYFFFLFTDNCMKCPLVPLILFP